MLCTFTKIDGRALVVRSEDILAIDDTANGCRLERARPDGQVITHLIEGDALGNRERLAAEEMAMIDRVNDHHQRAQQRAAQGFPIQPVPRGRLR